MNALLLKSKMTLLGISVSNLLEEMLEYDIFISKSKFYRILRGEGEFTRDEILALSLILKIQKEEIIEIFFTKKVAYRQLK